MKNKSFRQVWTGQTDACTLSLLKLLTEPKKCTLKVAVAQNNSGRLISVEPDHVVWAVGEFNKVREWIEKCQLLTILPS